MRLVVMCNIFSGNAVRTIVLSGFIAIAVSSAAVNRHEAKNMDSDMCQPVKMMKRGSEMMIDRMKMVMDKNHVAASKMMMKGTKNEMMK
jgi:hypothetical protein